MGSTVHIIGAGLAGCDAAFMAARMGAHVILHEMRPETGTEAHKTGDFAELVCSNSLRSDDAENNAVGLLHEEMRRTGSLILQMADAHRLPAGGALAVDREGFSAEITKILTSHPNIEVRYERVAGLPPEDWGSTIIATGPLTHADLAEEIRKVTGEDSLHFFDAIAPIVVKDTVNMDVVFAQSRYDKGDGSDYLNCPFTEDQYNAFLDALLAADKVAFHEWETDTPYFEGCLPVEVMASRGRDTLRFGPMKPVGLTDPHTGNRPYAVLQLRQDNALGTLWNLVGFQTKMKHGAQAEVFRLIPGLENAEFARFGGLHRNTFINSPRVLDHQLRLKARPQIRFAGQVTGVEGYVESAAIGLLAGLMAGAEATGRSVVPPPATTALGALHAHITGGANEDTFQPMNVTFGLFPDLPKPEKGKPPRGREKKKLVSQRALTDIQGWIDALPAPAAG